MQDKRDKQRTQRTEAEGDSADRQATVWPGTSRRAPAQKSGWLTQGENSEAGRVGAVDPATAYVGSRAPEPHTSTGHVTGPFRPMGRLHR